MPLVSEGKLVLLSPGSVPIPWSTGISAHKDNYA